MRYTLFLLSFLFFLSLTLVLPSSPLMCAASAAPLTASDKALLLAAERGEEANIRAALSMGARVNAQDAHTGQTALIKAIMAGNYSCVTTLLALGADPNKTTYNKNTPLIAAARRGYLDYIKLLLDYDADPSIRNSEEKNAANVAHENKFYEIENYLQNQDGRNKYTPQQRAPQIGDSTNAQLFQAAENGNAEDIERCIYAGANINYREPQTGQTALIKAIMKGNYETFAALLKLGADVNKTTLNKNTALIAAARRGYLEYVKMLVNAGANPSALNIENQNAIQIARQNKHEDVVAFLISGYQSAYNSESPGLTKAEYNYLVATNDQFARVTRDLDRQWFAVKDKIVSPEEWKVLLDSQRFWIKTGRPQIVAMLMAKYHMDKASALIMATKMRYLWLSGEKIRSDFMQKKERVYFAKGKWHYTDETLQAAQKLNQVFTGSQAGLIVSPDFDVTPQEEPKPASSVNYNEKLLQLSTTNNLDEVRKTVLMFEADIDCKDPQTGETPLIKALLAKQFETAKLLIILGANVNVLAKNKTTPLHIAARLGQLEIVKLLFKHEAKLDAVDGNNKTALRIAKERKHKDIVDFLSEKSSSEATRAVQRSIARETESYDTEVVTQ